MPPFSLIHGTKDEDVPYEQSGTSGRDHGLQTRQAGSDIAASIRAFYRNTLRELVVKRPAQYKHQSAYLE